MQITFDKAPQKYKYIHTNLGGVHPGLFSWTVLVTNYMYLPNVNKPWLLLNYMGACD